MPAKARANQDRRISSLGAVYEVLRNRACAESTSAIDDAPRFLGSELTEDVRTGCLYWAYWQLTDSILEARVLLGDDPHPESVQVIQWHGIRSATWPLLVEAIEHDGRRHSVILELLRSYLRVGGEVAIERVDVEDRQIQFTIIRGNNVFPLDVAALEAAGFTLR